MKKQILHKLLLVAPVLAILFAIPVLTKLEPNALYSAYENRMLAQTPQLTAASFWSGEYFSGWEDYLSDHIFRRDSWLRADTAYQMLRRSPAVNDVVITDQVLLPQQEIPDYSYENYDAEADEMTGALQSIHDQVTAYGGTLLYIGVPEQRSLFRDLYPTWQENNEEHLQRTEDAFLSAMKKRNLNFLWMRPQFEAVSDRTSVYSKVDHHYNLLGAYQTYLAACGVLRAQGWQFPVVTEDHITFRQLPNPFLGTYSRKLYGLSPVQEHLWVYDSDLSVPFTRRDNGEEVDATVLKFPENETQNVYYDLYMGGDKAETVIDTGRNDLPRVLIWGDSFTNAFESIAWMSFGQMRSLDLRYYTEKSLSEYIDEYRPDIVICIRDDLSYLYRAGNGMPDAGTG